jgi:acetyl-CoA acyltransferase
MTAVIIDAIRTPYGRRKGMYRDTRPDDLLAFAVDQLLERTRLAPEAVEDLIVGCVSQAGEQAANLGRIGSLLSRLPTQVPGVVLNRMCGSGQQAMHFAAQAVAAGDMDYVIAGGTENMTRVPMFLDVTLGRHEFRGFQDLNPRLLQQHDLVHQVESAELIAERWSISREDCDAFARESHRRANAAAQGGLHREIVATPGVDADGAALNATRDEGIRAQIDPAKMASLTPVMRAPDQGVVTAANASQISDGAAAMLVASEVAASRDGLKPRARIRARVACGSDPKLQLTGVIPATQLALKRAGLSMQDIDWFEINEAFASVVLAWARELEPDMDKVNPWGGAIAHGHPLGASGVGLMAKMLSGLDATGGTLGLQVMCIGHGMATATIVERI